MPGTSSGSPRARALGAELREARQRQNLSVRELARRLGTSHTLISRYETGARLPRPEDVASILQELGVTGEHRERALDLARQAGDPNWLALGSSGSGRPLASYIDFERSATEIIDVAPLLIPGLLQTADYARVAMTGSRSGEAETRLMLRLARREILTRRNPVKLHALICEDALRRPFGGQQVQHEQLLHLTSMAEMANVDIQVLPAQDSKWNASLVGPFVYLSFPKALPIVHLEHYRSSAFLYDKKVVADYQRAADELREQALSSDASLQLIRVLAAEIGETDR
ncbi:helix-turn-helix domain-containing protein [Saccharopolyspora sp. NPDC003752]